MRALGKRHKPLDLCILSHAHFDFDAAYIIVAAYIGLTVAENVGNAE